MSKSLPKLIVLARVAGVGKSTYVKNHFKDIAIVSTDAIRLELFNDLTQENNQLVFKTAHARIHDTLEKGETVVFDATNLTLKRRKQIFEQYKQLAIVEVHMVWKPLQEILHQNNQREGKACVPEHIIHDMYKALQPPREGFDCHNAIIVGDANKVEEEIALYKAKDDRHNSRYHLETIPEHIDMVKAEVMKQVPHLEQVALLHDLGKYVTRTKGEKYDSFIGHENVSAVYASVLGQPKEIVLLIQHHMQAHNLTTKVIKRYDLNDYVDDLTRFAICDNLGRVVQTDTK